MKKVAFMTTIFPMKDSYIDDFFNSLTHQTYKHFDIIIVNDGYERFDDVQAKYSSLSLFELKVSGTPAKNREYGINYVIEKGYDILIFGDSDDYFSSNRVEECINRLSDNDLLVNDIFLISNRTVYDKNYISNRVKNGSTINLEFIKDKNLFGFTNTAVNVKKLGKNVFFNENIIAVDWYFFSILLNNNLKAIFTNEAWTYYRQHENSLVGIGSLSKQLIDKSIDIKLNHYLALNWSDEYLNIKKLSQLNRELYINNLEANRLNKPLWWEEIRDINL